MGRSKQIPPPLSRDKRLGGDFCEQRERQLEYKQDLADYQAESKKANPWVKSGGSE